MTESREELERLARRLCEAAGWEFEGVDALEARQRVRQIESSLKVYDGANLEHAVKVLLRHLEGK